MTFIMPTTAAWRHLDARQGFEVAYFLDAPDGPRAEGTTTAVEDGLTWIVGYTIELDASWVTRRARITSRSAAGARETVLENDGAGHWRVDGAPAPALDGCLDVDLEASALTNGFPVHRLGLGTGERAAAPAAYVRAADLGVDRLEQDYARVDERRYDYAAPAFDFACRLVFDETGFVVDYPGLAVRVV
ncbi:hypothetical protein HII36_15155 [Nonomuraea sp. NN258]|uniref:putative glycolipid-binding domain-containing protein n=1 Tax=Nonomuraea antri TaxID=2730852 RepID=UPI0015696283|nr:putative glycolipid-binding domain-containing protein [Nonomuraea antri]NRQ33171.1 hypothetical protein [Nonomuraea antri]